MSTPAQSVSILMLLAAAGLASVTVLAARHRDTPGARGFSLAMFGAGAWTVVLAINVWPTQYLPTYVSMTLRNGLVLTILLGWLLLVVEYVRRRQVSLRRRRVGYLLVIPLVTVIITATNPLHHLAIGAGTPPDVSGGPAIVWGPWHLVFMAYAFTISLGAAGLLLKDYRRAHGIHRRQLLLLLAGFAVGFLGVNDYLVTGAMDGIPAYVRISPFAFLLAGSIWAVAVFRHQLLDVVPISRRTVVETIPDPVIALDQHGSIIDVNPAARRLCDAGDGATGTHITDFCDEYPQLVDVYQGDCHSEELTIEHDGRDRHFSAMVEPVRDGDVGSVIVLRDVTDQKESELELQTQRDNLEVLNQVVRHDIRNNLQLVAAYAEILQTEVDGGDQAYVDQVLDAARDAVDITTTARDVTEVMLQSDVDQHTVQLRSVLIDELEDARSNHGHALVDIDGSLPDVAVEADDMLGSVFRNLLTNAIEHNDSELPQVTVSAHRTDGRVVVRVADNGPGIADDRKGEIFEQGEMGLDSEGTGLGLYLVDTLVDRYGGEVRIEDRTEPTPTGSDQAAADEEPDGAVFVVELPIAEQ